MQTTRQVMLATALAGSLALTGACSGPRTDERPVLSFVEDDYAGALAQARSRQVPLFIEAWAPW